VKQARKALPGLTVRTVQTARKAQRVKQGRKAQKVPQDHKGLRV